MNTPNEWSLPVLAVADVVIVGGSTAAVAAALEMRVAGRRVWVIGDRSYFGGESAGALELGGGVG